MVSANLPGGDHVDIASYQGLPLPVSMTEFTTASSGSSDSFGRLRISQPLTQFDSKQLVDNQPLYWDDQQTSGSGTTSTYNTNQASSTLAVSNTTAGTRVRQTKRRFNYQPGKSHLILMTAVVGAAATGITKQLGYFDDNNGVFLQQTSTGPAFCIRTYTSGSAVTTMIAQSSWNSDKLDGTGTSGLTLDLTKAQILAIDFEWLGVGSIRFGFYIDGRYVLAHQVKNANNTSLVYMSTPNLPIRYSITNSGTGPASSIVAICSTVISEGGFEVGGTEFGLSRGATAMVTTDTATLFPLMMVRLKSTYLGAYFSLKDFSIVCTSTAAYEWSLILNPTGNATYTALSFTGLTNSAVEYNVSAVNTSTLTDATGTVLMTGVAQALAETTTEIPVNKGLIALGSTIAGTADVLVLAVRRLTGTTETFYSAMNWSERV